MLKSGTDAPPEFPLEVLGPKWSTWVREAADAAACPPDYVVAALLPAASALIGNARWAQAWSGWQEPPHLWCAAVGDSGQGKSPGADVLFRHVIPSIEASMCLDYAQGSCSGDALADSPAPPRFLENDLTVEKVAAILAQSAPKGLLMARDELAGWLNGINRFNPSARAFWLEAYGGRPYSLDRVKIAKRISVPRLAVAWYGGIQPDRLKSLMDADDGLLARFIWFWPDPKEFRRPRITPDISFAIAAFNRLSLLAPFIGMVGQVPIMVPLKEATALALESFARECQDVQARHRGLMRSALGKARGLVLRLSLVLEHLRWSAEDGMAPAPSLIQPRSLHDAIRLARSYFLPTAERIFEGSQASDIGNVTTLARWIAKSHASEIYVRFLQRRERLKGLNTASDIHGACQALVELGWLQPPPPGSNHGRARQVYRVRPEVWKALNGA